MARFARVVVPGFPHHVTQRGNRRQPVFFTEDDYRVYLKLMAEWCAHFKVEIWAYCLMPNHVHLVAVPRDLTGLHKAIGEAHRRYTLRVNSREGWKGHLWQERFASFPMEEKYLLAATRYIELNPVRAKLVKKPDDYKWSSARAHLRNRNDELVIVAGVGQIVKQWREFLSVSAPKELISHFHAHSSTGRPLGGEEFLKTIETVSGIPVEKLIKHKPGPHKAENPVKPDATPDAPGPLN